MGNTTITLQKREGYYNDNITKITDPFWTVACIDCGHAGWSLTHMDCCPECGSVDAIFTNPNIKISPSS